MKTVTLRIHERSLGPPEIYPMELSCDGTTYSAEIPAEEVDKRSVDLTFGTWGGRELGGASLHSTGGNPDANAEFSKWLFHLAFREEKAKSLFKPPVRLMLDIEPKELRWLRWELIGNGMFFPAADPECSVVRGKISSNPVASNAITDGPIKIMVVVGSKPNDKDVQAEEEIDKLKALFLCNKHEVELNVLTQPNRKQISDSYIETKPDIFHFIGHGDRKVDGEPYLVLCEPNGTRNVKWPLKHIRMDLGGHAPAFVFLNACHTVDTAKPLDATSLAKARDVVWSMSDLFIELIKVRGMLGMHAAIRGDLAGTLACSLYEALLKGEDLDKALAIARREIDWLGTGEENWDWALPYLRFNESIRPEQVLMRARVVPNFEKKLPHVTEFRRNRFFVNRVDEHRMFMSFIQPDPNRVSNLLLIAGGDDCGKTGLIRSCLEHASKRGRLIKYIELDRYRPENFIGILRLICSGDDYSLLNPHLPVEPLKKFYQTMNALMAGKDPRDARILNDYSEIPDWGSEKNRRELPPNGVEDQVKILFAEFQKGLAGVVSAFRKERADHFEFEGNHDKALEIMADDRPFLIVLDAVCSEIINAEVFRDFLVPHLVKLFAEGAIKDIVLVIAVRQGEEKVFGLDATKLGLDPKSVEVRTIEAGLLRELAEDYFAKHLAIQECAPYLDHNKWLKLVDVLSQFDNKWIPKDLVTLFQMAFGNKLPKGFQL